MERPDRLTEIESRSKSNQHRIDEMGERIKDVEKRQDDLDALTTSVAVMATKQETMEGDVKEIKQDVKAIAAVPAKRWESVVEKALMLLVGALITYALTQIGL